MLAAEKVFFLDRIGIDIASYTTQHILEVIDTGRGGFGNQQLGLDISFFDGFTHYYYFTITICFPAPCPENIRGKGRVGGKLSSAQLS